MLGLSSSFAQHSGNFWKALTGRAKGGTLRAGQKLQSLEPLATNSDDSSFAAKGKNYEKREKSKSAKLL